MPIEFYDVRRREKVSVDEGNIKKKTYTRETKAGKIQTRYALVAELDGSKLTKFVSQADWEALDAPVID
jgi:hypothetical protein